MGMCCCTVFCVTGTLSSTAEHLLPLDASLVMWLWAVSSGSPVDRGAKETAMCVLNGLGVPQFGGRESGIDDGFWAQSPESLPGLSDKLSDAMHILDSSYCPAGLSVTPILWKWGITCSLSSRWYQFPLFPSLSLWIIIQRFMPACKHMANLILLPSQCRVLAELMIYLLIIWGIQSN